MFYPSESFPQNIKQQKLFSTDINHVSWAANQYIRMIFEGSCDTEDWSKDNEHLAWHRRNKLLLIYSNWQIFYNNKVIFE